VTISGVRRDLVEAALTLGAGDRHPQPRADPPRPDIAECLRLVLGLGVDCVIVAERRVLLGISHMIIDSQALPPTRSSSGSSSSASSGSFSSSSVTQQAALFPWSLA
jgi:NitT/TauT family transport system permease protein